MEHFPENNPDTNERIEGKSSPLKEMLLKALMSTLQNMAPVIESVLNAAGVDMGRELRVDQKRIDGDYESFEKLSDEAGEFFSELIPKGIRKPEEGKTASRLPVFWSGLASHNRDVSFRLNGVRGGWKKDYREKRDQLLEHSLFEEEREPFEGQIKESIENDARIRQEHDRAVLQGDGVNLVRERVINILDKEKSRNDAKANLILQNIETGQALNLDSLLPSGWDFTPASLYAGEKEPGTTNNLNDIVGADFEKLSRFSAVNVKADDGFFFERKVLYGDLSEKGNVLALLHEIAHAWQVEFLDKDSGGRHAFERLYNDIGLEFRFLNMWIWKNGKDDTEAYEHQRSSVVEQLKKFGAEPYYDGISHDFWTEAPVIEDGVLNIKTTDFTTTDFASGEIRTAYYPVRSERLTEALGGYIADERDAWAHALKTMRFLRTRGIDIAPELDTLEEVKKRIDPCLESYQHSLEDKMGKGDSSRFLKT